MLSAHLKRSCFILEWFRNISMLDDFTWLIIGDFNLLRNPGNRNKPGGGAQEMLAFNEAISRLSLTEIPLKSCKFTFTWTNKWQNPLLERLDWFFFSNLWTALCPNTTVSTLSTDTSDHTPCLITASTSIPKPLVFRFENYWLEHD